MFYDIKDRLCGYVKEFMLALLLIQPLLDVASYFMLNYGSTTFTTGLRFVLLFTVSLYGFGISEQKKKYGILYCVITIFWIIHMLNCMRYGYQNPMGDFAEFLKLIQMPLWTASFITFFHHSKDLDLRVFGFIAANFGTILAVILISYLFGHPAYTYDFSDRNVQIGILGWFGVANTQSAVLVMLVPFLLLWAFRKENLMFFSLTCLCGLGLLYLTGTRLTYYGALIIAAAFLGVILLNYRDEIRFCFPLLISLILLLALQGVSPMAQRQALTAESQQIYQEKTDAVMGEDRDFHYKKGEEISPEILEKMKKLYTEVYGGAGVYGNSLLGELINRFGVEKVMEVYNYSIAPKDLYNLRLKRANCVKLIREEHGFITGLFGFEYQRVSIDGVIFDPENDFPAMLAYYGWVGTLLYIGMLLYFVFLVVRELFNDLFGFLTMETAAAGISLLLGLGAAQLSGQVLRKPSAVIYLALSAALLYTLVYPPEFHRFGKYQKNKVVSIKHL